MTNNLDARLQLAELEQIYRHAPVGLCFVDCELRYVRINEQLAAMNGKPVAAHLGRTIREMIPEVADEIERIYRHVIETGKPVVDFELHGTTAAEPGVNRHWLSNYFPLKSPEGAVVGVIVAVVETSERIRDGKRMAEYAERLQTLSTKLREVQESERRHLACEMHDEIGQMLTGLRLLLKATGAEPVATLKSRMDQARGIVDGLLGRVRGLSFDLRPAALDQLGLLPALLALFERYTEQTGVMVNFRHRGIDGRFSSAVETAVYRIVQEALTNVARHAGVAGADVRVWADATRLSVQIEDRGRGFDADAAMASPRSLGLAGMQERMYLLGGELFIESTLGIGTLLTVELPLPT